MDDYNNVHTIMEIYISSVENNDKNLDQSCIFSCTPVIHHTCELMTALSSVLSHLHIVHYISSLYRFEGIGPLSEDNSSGLQKSQLFYKKSGRPAKIG